MLLIKILASITFNLGSSKRAPVRLDGVEKAKSSDNDTGILCKLPLLLYG